MRKVEAAEKFGAFAIAAVRSGRADDAWLWTFGAVHFARRALEGPEGDDLRALLELERAITSAEPIGLPPPDDCQCQTMAPGKLCRSCLMSNAELALELDGPPEGES